MIYSNSLEFHLKVLMTTRYILGRCELIQGGNLLLRTNHLGCGRPKFKTPKSAYFSDGQVWSLCLEQKLELTTASTAIWNLIANKGGTLQLSAYFYVHWLHHNDYWNWVQNENMAYSQPIPNPSPQKIVQKSIY